MMKWQRGGPVLARHRRWLLPALIAGALLFAFLAFRWVGSWFDAPAPVTIAQASLQSMREQQRLISFSARYQAVVTTTQERLGGMLQAKKTMIMPGDVRYELDLSKLTEDSLRWDGATKTLSVTLPPIEISQPQIDLNAIQEYDNNSLLFTFTNAGRTLEGANREAAMKQLAEQAAQPVPMRLARDSARRAIARNFELPMRAAGVAANVEVRFADEPNGDPSSLDRSTPLNEVLGRPVEVKGQ
jgi:hypothetical protein